MGLPRMLDRRALVLLPLRRWTNGTRRPCRAGYLLASSLPAQAEPSPSSTLARAHIGSTVGLPRAVEEANWTSGLWWMRLGFYAVSQVRK